MNTKLNQEDIYQPIKLAGQEIRAKKDWVRGTHRAMDPAETLKRIQPHLHKAGITRVGDITGLDTVGIPVVVAVRPASGSLAVEAGKGVTLEAAAASATMEALERFTGEEDDLVDVRGSVRNLRDRLGVDPSAYPLLRHARLLEHRDYEWSKSTDLFSGEEYLIPYHLTALPVDQPSMLGVPFAASSNGLASGNHAPEALCAGLYEVIERDATSCWSIALQRGEPALEVDLNTIEGEIIGNIIEQVRRADCEPVIWWNPTECEIPTCTAYVYQRNGGVGMYKGYGCHLDPEIAMIRAVTEAVQARTIFVAGARDDLLRGSFQALRRSDVFGTKAFDIPKRMVSVNDIPDRSTGFFHGDVQQLLDGLRRLGIEYAFARELELGKQFEISVVRVVVPGLEPYRFPWIRQTERAHSFKPPVFA